MRGLFLAVLALLVVAGDTSRYIPQLVFNANAILASTDQKSTSDVEADHMRAAFSLLWRAALLQAREESSQEASQQSAPSAVQADASAEQLLVAALEKINAHSEKESASADLVAFPELPNNIETTEIATQQVNQNAERNHASDAYPLDTEYWLQKLVTLDNADAAWLLYQQKGSDGTSEEFMALAAKGNVPEAQLAYAMSSQNPKKREKWLIRAAEQGYVPAQAALADWYLLHDENAKAKPLLAVTASLDMQSAFKYGRLLWDDGEFNEAKKYLSEAAQLGQTQAKDALAIIERYSPTTLSNIKPYNWGDEGRCLQRIQPFASTLATMTRADSFYRKFKNDDRLVSLSLCVAPPVWLQKDVLKCTDSFNNRNLLGCDVTPLASIAKKRQFSHAVIVAKQGKANVQNGVMYLDIGDTYSVFVHELAHFAGFADEYPIAKSMATKLCNTQRIGDFAPPNLVIDSPNYYSPIETVARWSAIDPNTIVAKAKTCEGLALKSYKPSRRITFMEHHDSGVIPPLYLVLWQQQLEKQEAQRPISMNFFQAFHHKGNQNEAAYWLATYEAFVAKSQSN
ncbi:sel1 repeat family protein [Alteromonas hispanica]|uniref:Sel1 repeat family protein n=1 Tax=Alteromonas hispanica TaxID=315421 RepID=A0A6L9MQH5_9ALTE|nr:sel1 repeat family protein [Alteromonas hispanica]NDW20165.1 sel1 repeat family protein [Alteromonas hispanica]